MIIKNENYGFTLIELMLAISLFMILSSFTIINYRTNEKVRELKNQAQEVVSGLQKIQNMALTGETVNGKLPLSYKLSIAECSDDCSYKLSALVSSDPAEPEEIISTTALKSVTISIKNNPAGGLAVKFSPPRGKMALQSASDAEATYIDTEIEISNANHDGYFCVKLNTVSGRIDYSSGPCAL